LNFVGQLPRAPPFYAAHFRVKFTLEWLFQVDDLAKMSPTQLSTQCVHNLLVWKNLGETHHVEEVRPAKSVSKLNGQLSTQCVDYLFAVIGALCLEDVRPNSLPDLPIEQDPTLNSPLGRCAGGSYRSARANR
jgi:hypothetical protein